MQKHWQPLTLFLRVPIRGPRISIEMLLELLAKGATEQEIPEDYPELEPDDIRTALVYAHCIVPTEEVFDCNSIFDKEMVRA